MFTTISERRGSATKATPASGSEDAPSLTAQSSTLASGSDRHEWFYAAACSLLGKDPGLQLHLLTGYPVSSCSAYVHNEWPKRRRPPEHFIRTACHLPNERGFFDAFMHDCAAPWWLDFNRHADIGRKVLDITKRE
jgi:hypothetical protein